MNKLSIRTLPAAAAVAITLAFGAQAYAQTPQTTPAGTTKAKDAVSPAPGNSAMPARVDPGTTGASGAATVSTAPMGTMPVTTEADAKAAAKADKKQMRVSKRAANKEAATANRDGSAPLAQPAVKGDGKS